MAAEGAAAGTSAAVPIPAGEPAPWDDEAWRTILLGTCDEGSPLHVLRGQTDMLREVYKYVAEDRYRQHVNVEDKGCVIIADATQHHATSCGSRRYMRRDHLAPVEFPAASGRNVNMMPFIVGMRESLPSNLRDYWPLILSCNLLNDDIGSVAYLTVHEGDVPAGASQRRPGLHTESPGFVDVARAKTVTAHPQFQHHYPAWWGGGSYVADEPHGELGRYRLEGGIFMASTVPASTAVYDCQIDNLDEVVGRDGSIEHLRSVIQSMCGPPQLLGASELVSGPMSAPANWRSPRCTRTLTLFFPVALQCWMTDRTPHESLPMPAGMSVQEPPNFPSTAPSSCVSLHSFRLSPWCIHCGSGCVRHPCDCPFLKSVPPS